MVTKKKLIKKLIVTVNLDGLTETERIKKMTDMAIAAQNNPTVVPGLSPTPAQVITRIQAETSLMVQRDTMRASQKQLTAQIYQADFDLKNIFTDQWAPLVQQTIGNDVSKAKLLGFGIKGMDDGSVDEEVALASNSHPIISHIDVNVHLQQTLHIKNSQSGSIKLPSDAKQIYIYEQIGGEAPTDIKQMVHAGIVNRGRFINHFDVADLGKTVYYIAVYIDRKTLKPLEQSPIEKAIIN